MFGEITAHTKSTEILTLASAFILCFVLFIGMKLHWFRARMRLDTNFIRTGPSSVAATSGPAFSVAGVYRPFGSSSTSERQVKPFHPKADQKPNHHKSMPNLTENLKQFPAKSGRSDVTMKTISKSKDNLSTSLKTERFSSNAEDYNSDAANFQLMKPTENGDIYLSTQDMLTVSNSLNEPRQKKKTTVNAVSKKINVHDTDTTEMESGNLIFLNSNGKPISLVENKRSENLSRKTKSKAPAPPPPPTLRNTNFHEYEEFDT